MRVLTEVDTLRQALGDVRSESIALVPTMGCLHAGHVSLIRKARRMADIVVVSIYVNPMQFGAGEDFEQYPRTQEADWAICEQEGVDMVFQPQQLYADDGIKVSLGVQGLDSVLCGASRPGHFDGVVTVVNMLFNIVQPDLAIFGEKDWQQLTILRRMVADLHMPVRVVAGELIREADGLAMSSRNRYLTAAERQQALLLYQTLRAMQQAAADGANQDEVLALGRRLLQVKGVTLHYLEILNEQRLQASTDLPDEQARIFVAATVGRTRLIDNMPLKEVSES